jgi:NAD(P)-dependent dehydrogenase (short-subunit alcohol dehydrogenase family)
VELTGHKVVVIGGTSGIGLAVARAAVDAGASVVVASRRQSSVDAAVKELGESAAGQALDVGDGPAVQAFFDSVGPLDHLVYTAGEPLSLTAVADLDPAQARGFFETRFFAMLGVIRGALPHLDAAHGSITLTSGTAAQRPSAGWALAAGLCGATEAVTRALAVELAPIRVNAVAPGVLRSELWSGMDPAAREAMYDQLGQMVLAGRVGEVEDAARTYLYCMTQTFGTGGVIHVDGGTVLV